ncbi:MAG: hypothetical protein LWW97_02830 [Deltaproteobacteria bacterium]|nr:hypothetical protein [Deltaproteobacteria bacterium]
MNKRNSGNSIKKRTKELDCLYSFSSLVVKNNITVDEILQGTIDLIPPASQYPEITSVRIILENRIYKTKNFEENLWKQTSDIVVHGKPGGTEVWTPLSGQPAQSAQCNTKYLYRTISTKRRKNYEYESK